MARLARSHRIVWVNPRTASEGYRPLVASMAAALPHVDTLVSGHSLDTLVAVLAAIGSSETGAPTARSAQGVATRPQCP